MKKAVILVMTLAMSTQGVAEHEQIFECNFPTEIKKEEVWTWKETYQKLVDGNCKHALEITAQSILEAGWEYNSLKAVRINNIFGMKRAKNRLTVALLDTLNGYAEYDAKEDSVEDMMLWYVYGKGGECEDYYDFLLKKGYAQDTEYINKLKSIVERIKKELELC